MSSLILTNEAARRVAQGERWLSESDVVGRKHRLPGVVRLLTRRRAFAATAFASPGSRIYLRVIGTKDEPVDRAFWTERVRRAFERRRRLFETTDAFRVVHAEADGIPGVVIDKYNDVWSIQVTSAGAETVKRLLTEIIAGEFSPASVVEKNDTPARNNEGLSTENRVAFGVKSSTIVREAGEGFEVDVLAGQKTGAYLDYRAFRTKGAELARGRSLDLFCYQGWFSCRIAGSARSVTAVDSSAAAVEAARRNAERNGHRNISCVRSDALDYLSACGDSFDFIHLDPPSYAKGRRGLMPALSGYAKLLSLAIPRLAAGGTLMVSACSHAITERLLEESLFKAMRTAGRDGDVIYRGAQDSDHPMLPGHPESLYLKAVAARVV